MINVPTKLMSKKRAANRRHGWTGAEHQTLGGKTTSRDSGGVSGGGSDGGVGGLAAGGAWENGRAAATVSEAMASGETGQPQ
jgi:hypothetical protein